MASSYPQQSPHRTQRFDFIGSPQQRNGGATKDQRFVNLFPELIKSPLDQGKKYYLKMRPGLNMQYNCGDGVGRGIFYWYTTGQVYSVVGQEIFANGTQIAGFQTFTGPCGFCIYMNSATNAVYLMISDGSNIIAVDTTNFTYSMIPQTWVAFGEYGPLGTPDDRVQPTTANGFWYRASTGGVTGATEPTWNTTIGGTTNDGAEVWTTIGGSFPTPHIPTQPIYLDNYLCLGKTGTADIYNSDLGDPFSWDGDNFLTAEMYADPLVALTKNDNYMVGIGSESIEFFYDAANSTGSPFSVNSPAVQQIGCVAAQTVNQTEEEIILVGTTGNGGRTVWTIDSFKPVEIAIEPIRQALDAEESAIDQATAYTIQSCGHKWYVLNLKQSQRTFVYDFEENMWHEWTSTSGQACLNVDYATDSGLGFPFMLDTTQGLVYFFDASQATDNGAPIYCSATTVKIDFDSNRRKRFDRLSVIGDAPNGDSDVPMTIQVSDDDYNTWGVVRTLNLNPYYQTITQMGRARRRAFRFLYSQPYPLRLEGFEVDYTIEERK